MSSGQEVGTIFGKGTGPATALLRSPTVLIASIALWGMNVCLFRLFGIDYVHVLTLDLKKQEEEKKKRRHKIKGTAAHVEVKSSEDHNEELKGHGKRGESDSTEYSEDDDDNDDDSKELIPKALEDSVPKFTNRNSANLEITEVKLLGLSVLLMVTLYVTSFLWIRVGRGSTIGAIICFYSIVATGIMFPVPSTAWVRLACATVLNRAGELLKPRCSCLHGKPRSVPFIDVFFADAMCSMSKVFFDWGMLWLLVSYYPQPVPPSAQSIVIPSCFAALPYVIRARQCLIMYNIGRMKNCQKRYQHVLNAIKYSSSLLPLIVSAYQKTMAGEKFAKQLEIVLIILLFVNATYSLIWDIVMDWGMLDNPSAIVGQTMVQCLPMKTAGQDLKRVHCLDAALRPRLRFGTALTLFVVVIDVCLRFSWTLRFVERAVFPSNDAYILCTQFLEVFRRAVWNLLRVEWEHIKQLNTCKKSSQITDAGGNKKNKVVEMIKVDSEIIPNGSISVRTSGSRERAVNY